MVKVFFYKECQTVLIETEEKQMFYLFVLLLFKEGTMVRGLEPGPPRP